MFYKIFLLAVFCAALASCQNTNSYAPTDKKASATTTTAVPQKESFTARRGNVVIDGIGSDSVWAQTEWLPLDQRWLGAAYTPQDFQGRYKLAWSPDYLYILAEITDDTLIDIHPDGLEKYWDDDCLEVFVDENHSGGNHQYNYNAFAYHIALDGRSVDIGTDSLKHYFNSHIINKRTQNGKVSTWEVAVALYDDTFDDKKPNNKPAKITPNKQIGFALAYCDNDHSAERENFIGNVVVVGEDKNRGWIDAGTFGALTFK